MGAGSPTPRALAADAGLIAAATFVLLVGIILWLDNAQALLTGNGVFKATELKPWINDPATAPLYPSNYLFYPVYGALCRVLDWLGVLTGDPRRQITILNAASAALCLGVVYRLSGAYTQSRALAASAALFHLACSFVLMLAITNEDIMPSYTVTMAAMALAAVWFVKPTPARVLAVSVVFSLGWLGEWRLIFPALPGLLAALWIAPASLSSRLRAIALLLAGIVATASVAALLGRGHNGAVGPFDLLWTGKAVHSAWAGFSWAKVGYLRDGIAAYLLGTAISWIPVVGWDLWRYLSLVLMAGLTAAAASELWPRRRDPLVRSAVAVFGVTFVAGEVFNLYSQPQDPQMQINVMPWLTLAWLFALKAAVPRWRHGVAALTAAAILLLAYNVWSLTPLRGLDTRWRVAFAELERRADPGRTVFVLHDFDWVMPYGSLYWGLEEPGVDHLGPAPQARPKFKWIGFIGQLLRHSDWTIDQQTADLRRQIDKALALGYDVLLVRLAHVDLDQLERETGMVASRRQLAALQATLQHDYVAEPAFTDPVMGAFDRLSRANRD
ncbi:MAG: hypothetical protein JSS04_11465 [Proteobacteria bacterium]|nr:hypothetical protein [Pseudomonadota bacterium]